MRATFIVLAAVAAGRLSAGEFEPPFEGLVKVENRLHVRSGPGTNYAVLGDLQKGDRVVVVERKGDWCKVQMPGRCKLWVAAKYVDVKGPDGKGDGVVTGDDVNLRTEGSFNAQTVAQLSRGDKVVVARRVGDWLEVSVPDRELFAWVSAKFVEGVGPADVDAQEWLALRRSYQEEGKKDPRERRLDGILAKAEKLAGACKNPRVKERVDLFVKQVREEAEWCQKLTATERERQDAIAKIRAKYLSELKAVLDAAPPSSAYLLTGWLYECGNLIGGSPGTHKLVKGGRLVAYVRGNSVDLGKYYGKYVGVNGEDSFDPRYREPVIVIQSENQIHVVGTEGDR